MMNQVALIGRLAYDPELRRTSGEGKAVTALRLAVNRTYDRETADFFDVVAWGKTAENACKYLKKGSLVAVEGRLQSRSWTDRDGQRRYSVEVVATELHFMPRGGKDAPPNRNNFPETEPPYDDEKPPYDDEEPPYDDEGLPY